MAPPAGTTETAASPHPSDLLVCGRTGTVADLNVTLCGLAADVAVDNVTVTLDDAARGWLPANDPLTAGGNGTPAGNGTGRRVRHQGRHSRARRQRTAERKEQTPLKGSPNPADR